MNIKELKEILKNFPDDWKVKMVGSGYLDIDQISYSIVDDSRYKSYKNRDNEIYLRHFSQKIEEKEFIIWEAMPDSDPGLK